MPYSFYDIAVRIRLSDVVWQRVDQEPPRGRGAVPPFLVGHSYVRDSARGCGGVSLDGPATDEGRPGDEADRLFRRHDARMADRLRDDGLGVVLVDYLTSENVAKTCSGAIRSGTLGARRADVTE